MVDLAVEALEPTIAFSPAPDSNPTPEDDAAEPDDLPVDEAPSPATDDPLVDADETPSTPLPPSRLAVVHDDIGDALERTNVAVETTLAGLMMR